MDHVQQPPYTTLYLLHEDVGIIDTVLRRTVSSVAVSGKPFHEHVVAYVAQIIAEEASAALAQLRQMKVPGIPISLLADSTVYGVCRNICGKSLALSMRRPSMGCTVTIVFEGIG